jgi:hypothetical protein
MKMFSFPVALALGFASLLFSGSVLWAQGSAFTYQGTLLVSNAPASGTFDLSFRLFPQAAGGAQTGPTVEAPGTVVSGGLFTATLDFGAAALAGGPQWLEMAVARTGSGQQPVVMAPRQFLTSTPYAYRAGVASTFTGAVTDGQLSANVARLNGNQTFSGTVRFANVSGTFSGSGAGLTNLPSSAVGGGLGWLTGQIFSLPSNVTAFAPLSGNRDADANEAGAQTLSPNTTITLRNLSVRLDLPPTSGCSYVFTVRVNEADTALTCTVLGGAVTANSGAAFATIPPGSRVCIGVTPFGGPSSSRAFFGLTSVLGGGLTCGRGAGALDLRHV